MKRLYFIPVIAASLALAQDSEPEVQVAKAIPVAAAPPSPAKETTPAAAKEEAPADDSPVPLPALDHFAKLWTDSLFTTRALPMPDVPAGPSFTDNLTLSGTFEDNGKMTAVLIDKATSGIMQVYIGQDNEDGVRIAKIEPGGSPDKMRIQLQKGNQVGWVTFADTGAPADNAGSPPPGTQPQNGPLATRPGNNAMQQPQPSLFPAGSGPGPTAGMPVMPAQRPSAQPHAPVQAAPVVPQPLPAPSLRGGLPQAQPAVPGDPPLPPP